MGTANGPGHCKIENGGCWEKTQGGQRYSACQVVTHFPLPGFHLEIVQ
jgi:hypothetical protein